MFSIQQTQEGLIFPVFVQPRSSKNQIVGVHGDALKIKLTAPPADNAANKLCIEFLAKCLNVPKSSVEILSGQSSRSKRVLVRYLTAKHSEKDTAALKHAIELLIP